MSNWTPRTNRNGLEYGGSAHPYYWDPSVNPNANFNNCMANCTTYTYGRILEAHQAPPVQYIVNAGSWHNYVNSEDGWQAIPYNVQRPNIKNGDIIEWPGHVAVVENVIDDVVYVSSSLYTGDHGRAHYPPGSSNWDTRSYSVMGNSLESVCNWMIENYSWRFFEYVTESTITNIRIGEEPTWILVNPMTTSEDLPIWTLMLMTKKKKKKGGTRYL